jgi:hypothetical protein
VTGSLEEALRTYSCERSPLFQWRFEFQQAQEIEAAFDRDFDGLDAA